MLESVERIFERSPQLSRVFSKRTRTSSDENAQSFLIVTTLFDWCFIRRSKAKIGKKRPGA